MLGQQGFTIWFTGMRSAGKSTIAELVAQRLAVVGREVELIDADEVDELATPDQDANKEQRDAHVRRLGYVSRALARHGSVAVVAAVSPYREVRDEIRRATPRFVEVFVDCPFHTLLERDTRGLYRKALAGEITNLTGVQDPYEPPTNAEVVVDSGTLSADECAARVHDKLLALGLVSKKDHELLVGPPALRAAAAKAQEKAKAAAEKAADKRTAKAVAKHEKAEKAKADKAAKEKPAQKPAARPAAKAPEKNPAKAEVRRVIPVKRAPERPAAKVARPLKKAAGKRR